MSESDGYQVWVDVGGTFTDCFVVDTEGMRTNCKVLSSGVTKGQCGENSGGSLVFDPVRKRDPDGFWVGAMLRVVDPLGVTIGESRVIEFDAAIGRLRLEDAIVSPSSRGTAYELRTQWEAPVLATRWLLGCKPIDVLPGLSVRMGTTRGTNALLTRSGAKTALVVTRGFRDMLEIGYQDRPELFRLDIRKRQPLYMQVVEVKERLAADGSILVPIDREEVRSVLRRLNADGIEAIAVCLLHAYRNGTHEQAVFEEAEKLGFKQVSLSHVIAPLIKAVARGETTVVDAYLGPIIQVYMQRICEQLGGEDRVQLRVMTSGGGLVGHREYRGKDSVLSGPAGGVVALAAAAKAAGFQHAIGFDMGGTSTDVSRYSGRPEMEYESTKAGVRLMIPMLAIHTVAAGGGSTCWFDGVQLRVGPESAGAEPGPASYGHGGPLAITDLNLLLGRLDESCFPFTLDPVAARCRLAEVAKQIGGSNQTPLTGDELANGFRRIANQTMAEAIRSISISQGADPRKHVLVGFGGAAGQHCCEVAELLGMKQILDPPDAGLLSALGMGLASVARSAIQSVYRKLNEVSLDQANSIAQLLEERCRAQVLAEGVSVDCIEVCHTIELRYVGTDAALAVRLREWGALTKEFAELHQLRFGYVRADRAIELVALRCEVMGHSANSVRPSERLQNTMSFELMNSDSAAMGLRSKRLFSNGSWHNAWLIDRELLEPGWTLDGPGMITSSGNTTLIDVDWQVEVLSDFGLVIRRLSNKAGLESESRDVSVKRVDPVLREVLSQRIAAIATQMGIVLEQTAISVNIKERRDFSCAVFTADGDLVANAPHVPVHLGAMSQTVKQMMNDYPNMQPGDCFITNDPYRGGSHLPDVTIITPVFDATSQERIFFVANRAHHAEIGGIAPGSMAPTSTRLGEEGVIIPGIHLVRRGEDCSVEVRRLLSTGAYPSRSVDENMADIVAQQAANQRGEQQLLELVHGTNLSVVLEYLGPIQDVAADKVRQWIRSLGNQPRRFEDFLDDGTKIAVNLLPDGDSLVIDFAGTGPVSKGNFNANPAIVTAAVLYVVRCMIADTLPLNSGALRPLKICVPEGILNPPAIEPPEDRAAVAAGNVETSQRVVDCLLGALDIVGASQGTMNSLLFGDASFGYYETICGGAGATSDCEGADAVHTHMTNTRLTDPEVLESRYPVRLVRFEVRRGSGGAGQHRGGNGVLREIEILKPLEASLVTSRRGVYLPYGIRGGASGAAGENLLIRVNGLIENLGGCAQVHLEAGDRLRISTPGGGGYGKSI